MGARMLREWLVCGVVAISAFYSTDPAAAEDALKLTIGQRGVYENSVSEIGQDQGFFAKHDLKLEILYTQGGGETLQAVVSGAVDIGIAAGTLGTLGAFVKGAPVVVIGATMKGAYEFWYVPANSPIKSFADAAGKTVAYSTTGSSTNLIVTALQKRYDVKVQPVATGSPVATLTQVLSGQVDVGWSAAPIGVDALENGKIRIIAHGNDVPAFAGQTVRFIVVNAHTFANHPDALRRYMQAYRETLDWMYADPDAIKAYAKWAGISEATARLTRDEFIPKQNALPDQIWGLDQIVADAVALKYVPAPPTKEQLDALIKVPLK
jgi:NitT/TauT family transport system substrate-binding protein